ncbi:MAG: GNAT family acetyltransferase [Pseudomonadota bacterium]
MSHHIRPFREADRPEVIRLWEAVFPDDPPWNNASQVIDTKLSCQPELFFVVELQGSVVGTVVAGFDGVRGWVHKLAVDPAHRGAGYGLALMKAAEAGLAEQGCPKLNLQVRSSNEQVIALYRRAGYEIEERVSMGKNLT